MEQRHQPQPSRAQATFDYGQEEQKQSGDAEITQQQQSGAANIPMEQQHQPPPRRPGGSATIAAGGSATIGAGGRATVGGGGSATIGGGQQQSGATDIQMEQQHQPPPSRPGGSATIGAGGSATIRAGGTIGAGGSATIGAGGSATIGLGGSVSGPKPDSSRQQQQSVKADIPMEQQHQKPQPPRGSGGSITLSAGDSGSSGSRKPASSRSGGDGGPPYRKLESEETEMKQQVQQQYGTFDPDMDIPMEQQHQQPSRPGGGSVSISVSGGGSGRKPGGGSRDSPDGGPPYRPIDEQPQPEQQKTATSDEENYRAWLTITFKHLFEPFEPAGGMPLEEFQTLIRQHDIGRKHKLSTLFKHLDKDGNRRVSWAEFFGGMKYTQKSEVSKCDRLINRIIKKLTPAAKSKVREAKKEAASEGDPIPEESYLEAYDCRPPPIFFPLIFLAIWIFFAVYAVILNRGPEWNRVGWETGLPYYSPLVFCPSVRQQAWRFISYMFLHDGYHHIVFNTILGLLLGIPLETVHKVWRVGPVFLIGVIAGALASSIIDPKSAMVGASGGVYSLIGAHYATVIMNWEELQSDWLKCRSNPLKFLLSGVMTLVYLTLFVGLDFGLSAYRRYALAVKVPMSVSAHVGGMIAGLLVGTPVLRNIDKKPWEGVLSIVAIVIACVLFAFGVLWNIFYRGYPDWKDAACSNPSIVD